MEASLTLSIRCASEAQRDFVQLMLGDGPERPLFEDDVAATERDWFNALEEAAGAEWVEAKGAETLHAGWTLGGWEWETEVEELLQCLKGVGIARISAVVAGDEGWYQLWLLRDGKQERHDSWQGRSLDQLFDGRRNLAAVLDGLMG